MRSRNPRIFLLKNRSARRPGSADDALREASRTHVPSLKSFRSFVWGYWEKEGRLTLPWRKTKDPYKIFISEVMLQQTQVPRVIEKYKEFLKAFPNVRALAKASLGDVLRVWSGMGYNKRAKFLRDAAISIVEDHSGRVPKDAAALRALPGIGAYTASAVRVFAFNEPDILIETNVRAAIIHHFFPHTHKVRDSVISVYATKAAKGEDPRKWYSALMDYGVHIKKLHQNPARKSASYVRQSKFEGSLRQVRGAILRMFNASPLTEAQIGTRLNLVNRRVKEALASLARDGLIKKLSATKWKLA